MLTSMAEQLRQRAELLRNLADQLDTLAHQLATPISAPKSKRKAYAEDFIQRQLHGKSTRTHTTTSG